MKVTAQEIRTAMRAAALCVELYTLWSWHPGLGIHQLEDFDLMFYASLLVS